MVVKVAAICLLAFCAAVSAMASTRNGSRVTIDPSKPGPAISLYLYGQFIEHLGRCIRGGIWAEMLRDRKFLQEPGKSWEVVKPEGADCDVLLDPAGAYAGDHCMAIWARDAAGPCGIRQGGLGIVAGKEYIGYAYLASLGAPSPVEVRLTWGDGPNDGQSIVLADAGRTYRRFPFRFTAGATTDSAALSISVKSPAYVWVGCVSLMPADNVHGMRADVLPLIRRLNSPVTRWPGGNFVSGYDWKDGIGERDRRPPRWERAWSDVEDNDFGIDEFMAFCAVVHTEPYIAVNAGLGSASDAADEVEYANGEPDSSWGAKRAANGHRNPYHVGWWGVGNEMYGNWQLGHVGVQGYALRHNAYVAAMRARDPHVKIIAVGAPGPWNDAILPISAPSIDLLSGHHYSERHLRVPFSPEDARKYEEGFPAYSESVALGIRHIVQDMRGRIGHRNAAVDRVKLAIDEWGIVRNWDPTPDPPGIGSFEHYYCLGDAIATARAIHELLRSADIVEMANWAQTVNVIGAIKTSRTAAVMDPVGEVLALYREHLGGRLVNLQATASESVDAVASRDPKSGVISVALVNYSAEESPVTLNGAGQTAKVTGAWRIAGPSLGATNAPGQPESVKAVDITAPSLNGPVQLPPYSITVLTLSAK